MRFRSLRGAMLVGALVVACSSDDDDEGCAVGERRCATDTDCDGYAPPDFTILGPQIDARCFRTECVAEKCEATPIPGRLEADDTRGDCMRPTCDDEGRLERVPDRSDTPSRDDLEPCERHVCEEGFLGGIGPVTRPAPEGVSCSAGTELGTCSAGRCIVGPVDGPLDASTDATTDSEADASVDADIDAPADAATDRTA